MPVEFDSAAVERPGSEMIYGAAAPLERALVDVGASELLAIDAELIVENWDPQRVQTRNVAFLAWAFGVKLWSQAWPEILKREWIASSWEFLARVGTRRAFDRAFEILDRGGEPMRLHDLVAPPQWLFLTPGIDAASHEAWIRSLPEIRLYTLRPLGRGTNAAARGNAGMAIAGMFLAPEPGDIPDEEEAFGFFALPAPIDNESVKVRRAWLIEEGVETELRIDTLSPQDVEAFYLPWREVPTLRGSESPESASYADATFAGPDEIRLNQVARLARAGSVDWWNVARTARDVVSAAPRKVAVRGEDAASAFVGRFADTPIFLAALDADRLVYESWRLVGRGSIPNIGPAVSFADHSRLGMPPQTVELKVEKRDAASPALAFADGRPHAPVYLTDFGNEGVDAVRQAAEAAKSLRDRALIDFEFERRPTFGTARSFNDIEMR